MKKQTFQKNYKLLFLTGVLLLIQSSVQAQSTSVVNELKDFIADAKPILNLVVGILAVVGFVSIFFQYKAGNEKAKTHLIQLIIGLVVWAAMHYIIKIFVPTFTW